MPRMAERVRIGLIGCGGIARWHLQNLAKVPDAEVVALFDPDPTQIERCLAVAPQLAAATIHPSMEALLADPNVDAVELSTPHTQHRAQIEASFAAGKHVMCEKPLVTTTEDAHAVLAALRASGKVGLIGYQRHMIAEYQFIRNAIASGKYGAVTFVSALQTQEWKRLTKGTWRQDPALSGGGQLNDSGSHFVDIILWTTGLEPETVAAFSDNRETPVDIDSTLSIRFKGGAMGSIAIVGDAPNWHEDYAVWCEMGAFFMRAGKLTVVEADGSKWQAEHLAGSGDNPDAHFVRCCQGLEEPLAPFECGLRVIQLTEAAWTSAAEGGRPVAVG